MYSISHEVEVKGFGKWLDTSLQGEVAGHFNEIYFAVQLWSIIDPDYDGDYDNKPRDDEYYFRKQEEYQIIHPHFIRDIVRGESTRRFDIGDVVEWNDICTMRKGRYSGKTYCINQHRRDPDDPWVYQIVLEGSNETVEDSRCRIRPYHPWN